MPPTASEEVFAAVATTAAADVGWVAEFGYEMHQ
jgi:hypothetical protein